MTRIPFSKDEIAHLDANNPRKFEEPKSYGTIAHELNVLFISHNSACRTRGTVIDYYNRQNEETAVRTIRLPTDISAGLTNNQIARIVVSHCVKLGSKQ